LPEALRRRVNVTDGVPNDQLQSFDSNAMPWGELYIEQLKLGVPLKAFVSDPDTGMSVQMIRYAAGFTNKPFDIRYAFEDEPDDSSG
jgi:hypothetical protein